MTAWPATLPQNQFIGTTEQDVDAVLRTQMDGGPPSRRNRYTSYMSTVSVPIILTGEQRQTFDTFFRTTLRNGSLSFTWSSPVTDAEITYAFKSPPRWALLRCGTTNTRLWQATLELEVQP